MSGYMEVETKYGKKTLVCLVPKEGSRSAITCHEKTLCDCEVIELINNIQKENQELKRRLNKSISVIKMAKEYIESRRRKRNRSDCDMCFVMSAYLSEIEGGE